VTFDERAFVASIEAAGTTELLRRVSRPTVDEERALRTHLGDERYRRLHSLALRRGRARDPGMRGRVVVIHGVMGGQLTAHDGNGVVDRVWVNASRIMSGALSRLRLNDDGRSSFDPHIEVRASGVLKRPYGELLLTLSRQWHVHAFAYDWRKDMRIAVAELDAQITQFANDREPVHIVAHGFGGLVARVYLSSHAAQWERAGSGRVILLGTPNHGALLALRLLTGVDPIVKRLAMIAGPLTEADVLTILRSFPALYQVLPSPVRRPDLAPIYEVASYADPRPSARHLDSAKEHHDWLAATIPPPQTYNIIGYGRPTPTDVSHPDDLSEAEYKIRPHGDGWVPIDLGKLDTLNVTTFFVEEHHGGLTSNAKVLAALDDIIATGTTTSLTSQEPNAEQINCAACAAEEIDSEDRREVLPLNNFVNRMRGRSGDTALLPYITAEERVAEEAVTSSVLGQQKEDGRHVRRPLAGMAPTRIEIGLVHGRIEDVQDLNVAGEPIDVIAVGHYLDVKPVAAEVALDRAISLAIRRAVPENSQADLSAEQLADDDLILTQYGERGILRGELGQPFFLEDPRPVAPPSTRPRLIAVAGMGMPGRFGVPELTVLARELCWSVGMLRRRHLATVLIGAGAGNLAPRDAMGAWLRGIKHAITGARETERRHLGRITFVEIDPHKILEMDRMIRRVRQELKLKHRLTVDYEDFTDKQRRCLAEARREWERNRAEQRLSMLEKTDDELASTAEHASGGRSDPSPTRVTVELEGGKYRFGAIQENASIPVREVPVDRDLIDRANHELSAEWDLDRQVERGQFLERLLVPADLRDYLCSPAPLVLHLDSTMARVHWEMVALSEPGGAAVEGSIAPSIDDALEMFLGPGHGLTRQLRTPFAPPPEPPPPRRRVLRVLVVADPAEDARLPAAEVEGAEVVELFERANATYQSNGSENRIEVVALMGPFEATRTNVLRHLMLRNYDVLHFAGHATYDETAASRSGWLFTRGQRITASELQRIDRIPKFVFSNACQSGVTPDRAEQHEVDLAPNFAESFFARGVANLVCTAWPVEDYAAREFALTLYASLLGIRQAGTAADDSPGSNPAESTAAPLSGVDSPQPMYKAMRSARFAVARLPVGTRAWGAYQHYGKPYFRLFSSGPYLGRGA
jgi:pimeloyl-ACP methyl ester carboxylesterase